MMIPLSELIREHDVRPTGIIHVGAHEAEELESYLENEVPRVIWIEANPMVFPRLEQRLMYHPHHRAYHFAAHELDAHLVELNVLGSNGEATVMRPRRKDSVVQRINVATRTLDSFFRDENLDTGSYNFLYIDTNGGELSALKGAENVLPHFDYVYTDINHSDLRFDGENVCEEMDLYLAKFGFVRRLTRLGEALYLRLH